MPTSVTDLFIIADNGDTAFVSGTEERDTLVQALFDTGLVKVVHLFEKTGEVRKLQ